MFILFVLNDDDKVGKARPAHSSILFQKEIGGDQYRKDDIGDQKFDGCSIREVIKISIFFSL